MHSVYHRQILRWGALVKLCCRKLDTNQPWELVCIAVIYDMLSHSSPTNPCSVGVPQGSVLGTLISSSYTSPVSTIANSHQSLSSSTRTTRNSVLLFCQPITAKTFLHLSRVWTLFVFGFVKMAWPSTQQNQSPFCLAHPKGSNLFLVWNPVTSLVQTSNSRIKLKSWGPR